MKKAVTLFVLIITMFSTEVWSQVTYRWMDVGSLHNFYSNMGSEIEGLIGEQQAGWQWPAIYEYQDAQVSKALWLGVKNFTDSSGTQYEKRVVHVGPRMDGIGEFFPVEFKLISKYPKPEVYVSDRLQEKHETIIDEVNPDLEADRVLYSKMNTLLGITVERKIMQFSQQYHDNYHIIEYTFTNTGNTDADEEIELPGQHIEGFIPFFNNQMAIVKQTRFAIGHDTGWGRNTMNDRRGDGLAPEGSPEPEQFRAQFAWHGYWQQEVDYDNIGGPIIVPYTSRNYLTADDTTGRLGAYHFVGTVTLHADSSSSNPTDDVSQPFTMSEVHNFNNLFFFDNNAFDIAKMKGEYDLMSVGRTSPRHAYQVEPDGFEGFIKPSILPNLGSPGGFSYSTGYGPYTLAPGESVRIVVAEAAAGISKELAYETGLKFKNEEITAEQKNRIVFQGRDSLFQTFERALANFNSGFQIPEAPEPPSFFDVAPSDSGIVLQWDYNAGGINNIHGFEIYRASGKVDSAYQLLYKAEKGERLIVDGEPSSRENYPGTFLLESPKIGKYYFYYIVALGNENTDSTGMTPTGSPLISSRYYTQTYTKAYTVQPISAEPKSEKPLATALFQNYPNPFNPSTTISFQLEQPSEIKVQIFNMLGKKVATLMDDFKPAGKHHLQWNAKGFSSGVYFYRLEVSGEYALTKQLILLK